MLASDTWLNSENGRFDDRQKAEHINQQKKTKIFTVETVELLKVLDIFSNYTVSTETTLKSLINSAVKPKVFLPLTEEWKKDGQTTVAQ